MKRVRFLGMCAIIAMLAACTNPYERFYTQEKNHHELLPTTQNEVCSISSGNDPIKDIREMYSQGYALIGRSSFIGASTDSAQALEQASKVGAKRILIYRKYQNTENGSMPITVPSNTTSYHNGSIGNYGYSGVTTTYGTETTYIPYSVDKYAQEALYFSPMTRKGLGVRVRPASDEEKQRAQTNRALSISAVRQESPAFIADILPQDLILSINDQPVFDRDSLETAIHETKGMPARIALCRGDKKIIREIRIPESW